MIVVDLFSGLGGWSAPFLDAGHAVLRVDYDRALPADLFADVRELRATDLPEPFRRPDLVLASPPCEAFSVMVIGRNWHHDGRPKSDRAAVGLEIVQAGLRLIRDLDPRYWIMENPRDKLRVLPVVAGLERRTVTYCNYGERRMKPTDLFSDRWPPSLRLAPPCRNGDECHVRAPRGSRTGTQGFGTYHEKSLIPYALAAAVRDAVQADLDAAAEATWEGQTGLWEGIA